MKFTPKQTPKKSPKVYNANINNLLDQGASRHYYTVLLINRVRLWPHLQLIQIYTDVTESRIHLLVYTILKWYKGVAKPDAPFCINMS